MKKKQALPRIGFLGTGWIGAERFRGTAAETIAVPPDNWGGRCAVAWARQLRRDGGGFDPQAEKLVQVAAVLDAAYGR